MYIFSNAFFFFFTGYTDRSCLLAKIIVRSSGHGERKDWDVTATPFMSFASSHGRSTFIFGNAKNRVRDRARYAIKVRIICLKIKWGCVTNHCLDILGCDTDANFTAPILS